MKKQLLASDHLARAIQQLEKAYRATPVTVANEEIRLLILEQHKMLDVLHSAMIAKELDAMLGVVKVA